MLVIDGRIHPKILPTGTSAKIRNGVGVREGSLVVFAISEEPVTFHAFARLFRDGLNCPNALFLDGSVSSLYAPDLKRADALVAAGADHRRIGPPIASAALVRISPDKIADRLCRRFLCRLGKSAPVASSLQVPARLSIPLPS